jgi:hypothetical protein
VRSIFVRETAEPSPLASSFGLGVALGASGVLTLEALESIPSRFCAWRKRRWCDEDAMNEIFSHPWFVPIATTLVIIGLFPLVGYIVLVERKILADFQVRLGPMCVGPHGLLQPSSTLSNSSSRKILSQPTLISHFLGGAGDFYVYGLRLVRRSPVREEYLCGRRQRRAHGHLGDERGRHPGHHPGRLGSNISERCAVRLSARAMKWPWRSLCSRASW